MKIVFHWLALGLVATLVPAHVSAQVVETGASRATYSFEVSSVRPRSEQNSFGSVRFNFEADGFTASNVSLRMLLKAAYAVEDYQVVDTANLLGATQYDVSAKIGADTVDALSKLTPVQRNDVQRHMLRNLLAERFKLVTHEESKELQVYFLLIGKQGPKFRESKPGDDYANGLKTASGEPVGPHMGKMALQGGDITVQGLPIRSLVESVMRDVGKPVVDETGLTGVYDFSMQWQSSAGLAETGSPGPAIFQALEEQLGLKLEPAKAPISMRVVDHVEAPTPN